MLLLLLLLLIVIVPHSGEAGTASAKLKLALVRELPPPGLQARRGMSCLIVFPLFVSLSVSGFPTCTVNALPTKRRTSYPDCRCRFLGRSLSAIELALEP